MKITPHHILLVQEEGYSAPIPASVFVRPLRVSESHERVPVTPWLPISAIAVLPQQMPARAGRSRLALPVA